MRQWSYKRSEIHLDNALQKWTSELPLGSWRHSRTKHVSTGTVTQLCSLLGTPPFLPEPLGISRLAIVERFIPHGCTPTRSANPYCHGQQQSHAVAVPLSLQFWSLVSSGCLIAVALLLPALDLYRAHLLISHFLISVSVKSQAIGINRRTVIQLGFKPRTF